MRIDVLDLGSNTFHLLAAQVIAGNVIAIDDASVSVRLGERAFAKGRITDKAFSRGIDAIETLIKRSRTKPITVATGVFREAANARTFVEEAARRFGLHISILSGAEEARLTYHGVRAEALHPEGHVAVFDLGGGSLECLLGARGHIEIADSLPLGALRFAKHDAAEIREHVTELAGPIVQTIREREPDEVLLSSGTARALLRVARRVGTREQVVGCMSAATLGQLAKDLANLSPRAIAELGVSAARSQVIASGAAILATVVELIGVPFVRIAAGSLREGIALETATIHKLMIAAQSRSNVWLRSA